MSDKLKGWLTDGAPLADATESDNTTLADLRARVLTGLTHIGLSESHSKVVTRMVEKYGVTKIELLTEVQLTDLDRYISSVADQRASRQNSSLKAVS